MGIVLQAGSVAAAIGSILGLVAVLAPGLLPGGGDDGIREVTAVLPKGRSTSGSPRRAPSNG